MNDTTIRTKGGWLIDLRDEGFSGFVTASFDEFTLVFDRKAKEVELWSFADEWESDGPIDSIPLRRWSGRDLHEVISDWFPMEMVGDVLSVQWFSFIAEVA